ncbi:COG1470 family protein [Paractinoplanes toevensis]|uniref:Alpha-galactosidase NEW3 domain-containing protein n=1 Tax=Paractinoplanes toevensis TaxID=571911 RepID=A0A919TE64_9ACTN|nr:hypothetical protein [Actinoplanes toevensis]GIM93900.1 hypothetical protein Ato02nite_056930 [Actinoplanes toevensis]
MTLPLRVNVAPERADASPGDNLQFDVTVRNASDIVEHYGVELLGLPDGATVRTEPEVAKLRPAESGTLIVKVNLPVQPPAPAGTYVVGALVRSKYRHDVSRCVEVPIELASVEQITLRTTPEVVTGGRTGQYTLEIANGGNAPVRLYLTATDPERRVSATFQPAWLDLPPGSNGRALLNVSAPLPWNKEKQRQLTLAATPDLPNATPVTGTATFVQQPRIASKFAKVAGIAAGVIVLAAAIAVPALLNRAKDKPDPAAVNQTAAAPTAAATTAAQQQQSAAPPAASAAAPSQVPPPVEASSAAATSAAATTGAPAGGGEREIDLTTPPPGVVGSDVFRNQGFLVSGDPKAVAVAGCENARSAAVVEEPTGKFLTSSSPDDPARCHEVPLLIDFLSDGPPVGAVKVTPLTPNTLIMEVTFRDFQRADSTTLSVSGEDAAAHGGVDQVLIRSSVGPVAITKLKIGPLS